MESRKLVEWCFALTGDYLPNEDALNRRAEAWLKLLTPAFFGLNWHYIVRCACRLRPDRRDAIKADELLRIAEKVAGCPIELWSNELAAKLPLVWSEHEKDWMPLQDVVDQIWEQLKDLPDFKGMRINSAMSQVLEMIYGGNQNG